MPNEGLKSELLITDLDEDAEGNFRETGFDKFFKKPFHLTNPQIIELAGLLFPQFYLNKPANTGVAFILSVKANTEDPAGFDIWFSGRLGEKKHEYKCSIFWQLDFNIRAGSDEDREQGKDDEMHAAFNIPIYKIHGFLERINYYFKPQETAPVINPLLLQDDWQVVQEFKTFI